jgi:4-hydroxybenzoate polyprenyltransferase
MVALACAITGLAYGTGALPAASDIEYVVAYGFLIYPYFVSRELSLEGIPRPPDQQRDLGLFVPFVLFCFIAALVVLWVGNEWQPISISRWLGSSTIFQGLAFLLIVAVLPFAYLFVRTQIQIRSAGTAERERLFKNKVLFPALATCLVSFSLGWATTNQSLIPYAMATPVTLIVLLKEISVRKPTPILWTVIGFLVILSAAFILFFATGSRTGLLVFFGVILTLAMGVAEVCKRVVKFPENGVVLPVETRDGHIISEGYDFYLSGANWSSVLFPLLLCLIPLLISELPVLPIFIVLSVQYLHWHFFARNKHSAVLFWFNVCLGFTLPLVLSVQYVRPIPTVLLVEKDHLDLFFAVLVAALGLISTGIPALHPRQVRRFLLNVTNRQTYVENAADNCFMFFLLTLFAIGSLIVFIAGSLDGRSVTPDIAIKGSETMGCCVVLLGVALAIYLTQRRNRGSGLTDGRRSRLAGGGAMSLSIFWILLIRVARLPVAIIAGSVVTLFSAVSAHLSWYVALVQALPIVLTTMTGFVVNDICDIEKDRLAGSRKPLAEGLISRPIAERVAAGLVSVALLSAALLSQNRSFAVIVVTLFIALLYSAIARRLPLAKGLVTAVLCCAPFAYTTQIASIVIPGEYYLFLLLFVIGRELLLDVRDYWTDRAAGLKTVVSYLKPGLSRVIGWALMTGSVGAVTLSSTGKSAPFFWAASFSLAICGFLYTFNENRGLAWSRLTLLLGVIAVSTAL